MSIQNTPIKKNMMVGLIIFHEQLFPLSFMVTGRCERRFSDNCCHIPHERSVVIVQYTALLKGKTQVSLLVPF